MLRWKKFPCLATRRKYQFTICFVHRKLIYDSLSFTFSEDEWNTSNNSEVASMEIDHIETGVENLRMSSVTSPENRLVGNRNEFRKMN